MKRILNIVLLFSLAILLLLYRANAQDVCENNYACAGTLFKYNISTVAKFDIKPTSVVYRNDTLYVSVDSKLYSILKNGTVSTVATLACSPYGTMILDKYDNFVFVCYVLGIPNVYSYSLDSGSLVKTTSFTSEGDDFSFTYDPETETYYYVTSSGFCTKPLGGSITCDTGLVKSSSLAYYNGYIYNKYARYADSKITRWEKNKPFSASEYMIVPSGGGITFNSRGEMFVYTSTEIVKYVDGGKFTIVGGSSSGYSGDGGVSTNAVVDGISSLAFDEFGNIFFTDYFNSVLRQMTVIGCMDLPYVNSTTCEATCSDVPLADPNICSGYGKCDISSGRNSTCICAEGYSGIDCETPICFGVKASDPNVCGGNGTCTSKDTCECYDGASGLNCQDFICFNVSGASPNVCSEYGLQVKCIGADVCEHTCFGIGASSPTVCSGQGVCISENNCSCSFGRNGSECENSQTC